MLEANLFGSSYIYCHVFNLLEYAYTVIYLMLQCDKMYYSCFDIGNWIFFLGGGLSVNFVCHRGLEAYFSIT